MRIWRPCVAVSRGRVIKCSFPKCVIKIQEYKNIIKTVSIQVNSKVKSWKANETHTKDQPNPTKRPQTKMDCPSAKTTLWSPDAKTLHPRCILHILPPSSNKTRPTPSYKTTSTSNKIKKPNPYSKNRTTTFPCPTTPPTSSKSKPPSPKT